MVFYLGYLDGRSTQAGAGCAVCELPEVGHVTFLSLSHSLDGTLLGRELQSSLLSE